MYIYKFINYIKSLCILRYMIQYDTQYGTIHDIEELKINSRYDSRFDNYVRERDCRSERRREKKPKGKAKK